MDHCPADIQQCCFDNNHQSYFDTEAIGSCTDYQHLIHPLQCLAANANDFVVVDNYRRRHYQMPMPTYDALKFLVANTDAAVDCPFAVAGDFPSRQHFERALASVVCQTYRVDSVMLSANESEG